MATQQPPELTLPGTGEVQAQMEDPAQLSPKQWAEDIIGPLQLLKGWRIGGNGPEPATEIAFELIHEDAIPNFSRYSTTLVEASLAYTERTSKFISSGFNRETAAATYGFVSASAEHTHSESRESQSEQRNLYIKGSWNVTTARLFFSPQNIRPTAVFSREVDKALEGDSPSDQYLRLCRVFETYGQVFASQVILGGQLFFDHEKSYESTSTDQKESSAVKAAVHLKVGKLAGEAGAELGKSTEEYKQAVDLAEGVQFLAHGGEQIYAQKPDRWLASLAPHNNWYPISLDEITPIYELLDEARQAKIKKVLDFVMSDPPMRLRRFTKQSEEKCQHHATCTLRVPPGYKIISGGARVIADEPPDYINKWSTILNMLWASYPTTVDGQDAWQAESWDCKTVYKAHIEISVIALYDPDNEWDVMVFHDESNRSTQGENISVKVDDGYYLTGGGAEVFESTSLATVHPHVDSFLVASYPDEMGTWTARSHDHVDIDRHKLRVYAIGVRPRNGRALVTKFFGQASGEKEEQYPHVEAEPDNDYALVGGGADVNKEVNHHLVASYPFATSKPWRATGWKADSTDHQIPQPAILTAYAIGVKGAIFPENLPEA